MVVSLPSSSLSSGFFNMGSWTLKLDFKAKLHRVVVLVSSKEEQSL